VKEMTITQAGGKVTTLRPRTEFTRLDTGIPVPLSGDFVMANHEWFVYGGKTRHAFNQPNQTDPRPAVVNKDWGLITLAQANGDYYPISNEWQYWFYNFWDHHSGYLLPVGKKIGEYVNPMNPGTVYTSYTPGSKLALYAGMIMDAKSHSDSAPPEKGSRDVVTGRNLTSSKPWQWLCRPCTGALLKVIERQGTRLKIEAIDLWKPPPDVRTLPPHLFYFGTQVHIDGQTSRYPDVANAFRLQGRAPAGTAMPLVAPGGYFYIDRSACVELQPGQMWTPYY
jgi:hypothetical protein